MRYVTEPSTYTVGVIDRVQEWRAAFGLDDPDAGELNASAGEVAALVDEVFRLRGLLERDHGDVRRDERRVLAELFTKHRDVLTASHPDGIPLDMVAFLLTLGDG